MRNDLTSNQITIIIVDKRPVEEEPKVPMIPEIPEEQVTSKRDTLVVSMLFYILIIGAVLKESSKSRKCNSILMSSIWKM